MNLRKLKKKNIRSQIRSLPRRKLIRVNAKDENSKNVHEEEDEDEEDVYEEIKVYLKFRKQGSI